jgi:hypothetical protein
MPPSQNSPRKGIKFLDTKVFIAALSVAITVGFWNLFSNNAYQSVAAAPSAVTQPVPDNTNNGQDYPPLPTLVPLVDVTIPVIVDTAPIIPLAQSNNMVVSQEKQIQPKEKTALRAVAVPTQKIVQKGPIMSQSVDTSSSSNGGGSSSGGGKKSAATTKSSKK